MQQQESIILSREPYLPTLFAKAAFKRTQKQQSDIQLPALSVNIRGVKIDHDRLRQYHKVCGFQDNQVLPPTYPQIMAFGPYMRLLTDPRFPLPLIGLVHLRNEITQYRPILPEEVLDFECSLAGQQQTDKGLEFDILTKVYIAGRLVWENTATLLHRNRKRSDGKRERKEQPRQAYEHRLFWQLPENLGRQYAQVSGDYNLIHLHLLTARLFGFKQPIAHGLWSKARCLAQLTANQGQRPLRVKVSFKLPIFLPGTVDMVWRQQDNSCQFELVSHKDGKPHLEGTLEWLD